MRSTGVIATVAVVASVAVFALLNSSSFPQGTNFLSTSVGPIEQEFVRYLAQHQKNYSTKEEYVKRLAIFTQKFIKIMKHNNSNEKKSFEVGTNPMTDWTAEEF
jgi:Cathepsin propeptide inhibitor domain (I29)